jgi:hypothetical protein
MTGYEHHLRTVLLIGKHNPGVGRHADSCCHARHDFEAYPGFVENGKLIRGPSEDAGIAAFEPDDRFAFESFFDNEPVNLNLCAATLGRPFGNVEQLGVLAGETQKRRIRELIAKHTIGISEYFGTANGYQIRPTRSGAY